MTSLLAPRRIRFPLSLRARSARDDEPVDPAPAADPPPLGWVTWAVGGAWAAALATWVISTGVCVLGWLAAEPGSLRGAIDVGTQLWLLANGAGARLGSTPVTLVPWGVTAVAALVTSRSARLAAGQARGLPWRTTLSVTAVTVLAYLAPLTATASLTGGPAQALRGAATMAVVIGLAAAWGASRSTGWVPSRAWPAWARSLPRAALAAQLVLLAGGAAALVVALVARWSRVVELTAALQPGPGGGLALVLAQLAFAPNVVVWAAAYALGAGFTLGDGSVVAPAATEVGLLPAVPLLGALPAPGPGDPVQLAWLVTGAVAGAVAAWIVVRARPVARVDETSLVGGLSGLAAAVLFCGLAWATGGDLGVARLAGLGPRLLPLLVVGGTTLGLAGMATGLALGLARRARARRRLRRAIALTAEPTVVLGGYASEEPPR